MNFFIYYTLITNFPPPFSPRSSPSFQLRILSFSLENTHTHLDTIIYKQKTGKTKNCSNKTVLDKKSTRILCFFCVVYFLAWGLPLQFLNFHVCFSKPRASSSDEFCDALRFFSSFHFGRYSLSIKTTLLLPDVPLP